MTSLNRTMIIGNLGADPEIRYMPNGMPTASITVATTDTWIDKETQEKKEKTEWHRVVFFRGLAEVVGKYLKKGSQIYVEGKSRTRKWKDKENIERYTTEIVADQMKMLGKKADGDVLSAPPDNAPPDNLPPASDLSSNFDDDIPM